MPRAYASCQGCQANCCGNPLTEQGAVVYCPKCRKQQKSAARRRERGLPVGRALTEEERVARRRESLRRAQARVRERRRGDPLAEPLPPGRPAGQKNKEGHKAGRPRKE